jgi:hypothetical protein
MIFGFTLNPGRRETFAGMSDDFRRGRWNAGVSVRVGTWQLQAIPELFPLSDDLAQRRVALRKRLDG